MQFANLILYVWSAPGTPWPDSEFSARAYTPHPSLSLPARVVISAGLQLPVADFFSFPFATATRQKDGGTSVSDCRRVTVFADDSSYSASVECTYVDHSWCKLNKRGTKGLLQDHSKIDSESSGSELNVSCRSSVCETVPGLAVHCRRCSEPRL